MQDARLAIERPDDGPKEAGRAREGTVLVTGGAGFIGSRLVGSLSAGGSRVRVLDNFSVGGRAGPQPSAHPSELIRGDILDPQALARAVEGVECVVHLAAQASVPLSVGDPRGTMRANVEGTRRVVEAARDAGAKRLVFASTCAVYGNPGSVPVAEGCELDPLSPYGLSKAIGELLCRQSSRAFPEGVAVLRFFNVYGPKRAGEHNGSAVDAFAQRISGGEDIVIYGDGSQTRDFVHVQDVIGAIELAISEDAPDGTFNVGTGVETSIIDLARTVGAALGQEVNPVFRPRRAGDVGRSAADTSHAKGLLGFDPKFTIEAGVRDVLKRGVFRS